MRRKCFHKTNLANESNSYLVDCFKYDKSDALANIMKRFGNMVHLAAMNITKNHHEAEEISQEVFISVYQNINKLRSSEAVSSWIYKITINIANSKLRSKAKNQNLVDISEYTKEEKKSDRGHEILDNTLIHLLDEEAKSLIQGAIRDLPPKYKCVIVLSELQNYTLEKTGSLLNLSLPAVKSRLHRARKQLKDNLSNYFSGNAI